MPEFTPLREDVGTAATRRGRRRMAMGAAAAATAVLVVVGVTAAVGNGQDRDHIAPVGPARTPTPSTGAGWPLERIRAEGALEDETVTATGITVRVYGRCDESLRGPDVPEQVESVCDPGIDPPIRRAHTRYALEVAQNGRTALFSVLGEGGFVGAAYGDEAIVYSDHQPQTEGMYTDRYRLLRVDGTEAQLQLLRAGSPVPPVPTPGAFVLHFDAGPSEPISHPFVLDEGDGTLRPLAVWRSAEHLAWLKRDLGAWHPETGLSWGPNPHQALWFVNTDCTVHWGSGRFYGDGGTFTEHHLACGAGFDDGSGLNDYTYVTDDMFPKGWLRPGRMAAIENSDGHLYLHVTLDQGNTWQRLPIGHEAAIPDTLRQIN